MAQPITWQNVNAPSTGEASRAMYLGQLGINQGFDKLGEVLKQQEAVGNANWNQQKTNNTEEVYRQMAGFDTPEAYQAAIKSGVIQDLLTSHGAQIDQAGVRQAMDSRMATLQDRTMKANAFQESTTKFAAKPFEEQAMAMAAVGNMAGVNAILSAHPEITDTAPLINAGFAGQKAANERSLTDALRPGAQANALAKQSAETLQMNESARIANEAATTRKLDNTLQRATAAHLANKETQGLPYGELAKLNSIPVDSRGIPRYESMTKRDIAAMDHLSKANGLPLYSTYANSDTKAADNLLKSITDSGEFTPEFIQKNRETIRGAANSTPFGGSVGDTAQNKVVAEAQTAAAMEDRASNTWYAPGSANALRSYDDIAKRVPELVRIEGNRDSVQRALATISRQGITLDNGTKIVPSVNDVLGAIRSTTDGIGPDWMRGINDHGENVYRYLKKNLSKPDSLDRLKDSEELNTYTLREAAKKKLSK